MNTHGTTQLNPIDVLGRSKGNVLNGGNVTVKADRGYVVVENGAVIDVSGTSAYLDLPSGIGGLGTQTTSQKVGSDAGKISISAAEGIVLDGTFYAQAGAPTNRGGSLDVTLDRNQRRDQLDAIFPTNTLQFNIEQDSSVALPVNAQFGSLPETMNGLATVSSNKISQAGFDSLKLTVPLQKDPNDGTVRANQGVIKFLGDVDLKTASSMVLDAQNFDWAGVNSASTGVVKLHSSYLQLGSSTASSSNSQSILGGGKLTADATWMQIEGSALMTGFNEINLNSLHDMRVVGVQTFITDRAFTGSLNTAADLFLSASQIYPTTLTSYNISVTNPTGQLTIAGHNSDVTPLSAAGQLKLSAATINQNGVLKAPLGTIELNATTALGFGKDSLTSVSADGKTIPFGFISNNVWEYPLAGNNNLVFNKSLINQDTNLQEYLSVGEKHLKFQAPDIQFNKGSIVDVSGGGDLLAAEFQPGLGGSNDYLANSKGFAILPSLGSSLAPFDPYLSANFAYDARATVYLNGTGSLAAGYYTILPARYALLPGAYLVTPQAKSQDQVITSFTKYGLPIVSGYQALAGTNARDSRTSGFLIETGADVKKHSQYNIQTANSFFANNATSKNISVPLLPVDAGQISIDAGTKLVLDGQFNVAAQNGKGAKMDISASSIKVVKNLSASATPGILEILDQQLSNLHVDSLLLGGTRKFDNTTGNTNLTVSADNVSFEQGTQLQMLDLIAAGKTSVEVKNGAVLSGSGSVNTGDSIFNITGDSALLRVSADKQVTVNRSASSGLAGSLLIDQGAVLQASKSMLLDASKSTALSGDIVMHGGSLNLTANTINIGEISGTHIDDLNLNNQKLSALTVDDLILSSRGSINFYGNVGQLDGNGNLAPIKLTNLVLDAVALSGFDNAGKAAKLQANNMVLQNSHVGSAGLSGTGNGELDLIATQYHQGSGSVSLDGFNTANINVANQFTATGNSVINSATDLNLIAGLFTTTAGSKLAINANSGSGHNVSISGNADTTPYTSTDFGGAIAINANKITLDSANILLPSGSLNLQAQIGDILVQGQSKIDLAGRAVNFADVLDYTPGGTFSANAALGAIKLTADSLLDISTGGGSAAGGKLNLAAPTRSVELAGNLKSKGASASFDVSGFAATQGFDGLMNKLMMAGVADRLYFRTREANITQALGNTVTAKSLTLVADKGAIDIAGTLNADGPKDGGAINIYAGDKITLDSTALLTAKVTDSSNGGKGGTVSLASYDPLTTNQSGINLISGSKIDVSGSSANNNNTGGVVKLTALRTGGSSTAPDTGINIKPIADGTVIGASQFYAVGVKKYTNDYFNNSGVISVQNINNINTLDPNNTASYMAAAAQNVASLGGGISLRPGIEIDYHGDLTLASAWDFSNQRFGQNSVPGELVITASGKLNLNNSLTDGFDSQGILMNGNSWSFQLVSGADQGSADKFATVEMTNAEKLSNSTAKDLTIGSGASVHTGAGDIKLASGGNIVFTDQTSTVYNAGRADVSNPYGSLASNVRVKGEYPIAGGDIIVRASADIIGAISNQFLNPWFQRQGTFISSRANLNRITAWAVDASQFQQNIGSFGGGIVDIAASGNINDLSVMMPTTGKQLGTDVATNNVQIQGGGQMRVNAGGNITGGAYFLGKGEGIISAAGEITGSTSSAANAFIAGPQIVMSGDQQHSATGSSNLSLQAGSGIKVAAVSDAMVLVKDKPEFFSYTDKGRLTLKSLSGDIHLNSDTSVITNLLNITNPLEQRLSTVYPASLDATAFGGSVKLDHDIILFPSAVSNLNVLAKQDITSSVSQFSIIMSDADPAQLPNALSTINQDSDPKLIVAANIFDTQAIGASGIPGVSRQDLISPLIHAKNPVHGADKTPARLVTRTGDISNVQIILPKQSIVQSGRDLTNSPIQIQQIHQDDASIISAGRDIFFETKLDTNGNPIGKNDLYQISISGPGNTLVKTGRNLDLGASSGLTTVGNIFNSNLSSAGASLNILVGLNGGAPSYTAFIEKYLQTNTLYSAQFDQVKTLITGFMQERTGNTSLTADEALKAFGSLTSDQTMPIQTQLNAILTKVFFNELKLAGSASASDKSVGNKGGFAAIDTLFPGSKWQGDLNIFFSRLHTVTGGNINLFVPGGQVNAGLAVAPSGAGAKGADKLGIVAQAQGDINAFVKNDFIVNTSRVFTLGGGDVLIWSSDGNIDAGKGAKSALAVSVQAPFFDVNNQLVIPAPKITSGSGIRTAASPGIPAGDVFLFAPKGVVDAGEAGIGGTNVTISATAVLGANNIQVGGVGTGVPVASTGSLAAGLTGTGNVTANATQAAQAATGLDDRESATNKNVAMGMLSVEVLGFGE